MSESSDSRGRAVRKVKPFLEELEAKPFWTHLREHKLTAPAGFKGGRARAE